MILDIQIYRNTQTRETNDIYRQIKNEIILADIFMLVVQLYDKTGI
jgi:hypothetical protein